MCGSSFTSTSCTQTPCEKKVKELSHPTRKESERDVMHSTTIIQRSDAIRYIQMRHSMPSGSCTMRITIQGAAAVIQQYQIFHSHNRVATSAVTIVTRPS